MRLLDCRFRVIDICDILTCVTKLLPCEGADWAVAHAKLKLSLLSGSVYYTDSTLVGSAQSYACRCPGFCWVVPKAADKLANELLRIQLACTLISFMPCQQLMQL